MKLTKTTINIKTNGHGEIPVTAYSIGNTGLYIHRIISHDLKQTNQNYWSISHETGYSIISQPHKPYTRKEFLEKTRELLNMDWKQGVVFWGTQEANPYVELVSRVSMKL
jgi:hypothetical protein